MSNAEKFNSWNDRINIIHSFHTVKEEDNQKKNLCKYHFKIFIDRLPISSMGNVKDNIEDVKIKIHQKAARIAGREWPRCSKDGTVLIDIYYQISTTDVGGFWICPKCSQKGKV